MSEPIRSASASSFAAARPQVQSRRVSLRLGSFGLTYSTDRLLWNADAPPVDPAPAVESEPKSASQATLGTFPLDLEAARRQSLWQAAQQQAAQQQAQAERQKPKAASGPEANSPAAEESAQARAVGASVEGGGGRTDQMRGQSSLRQAMRQATQAYLACAERFACPRPMIQAVA